MRVALILVALAVYIVLPFDLVPDFLGPLGWVDDFFAVLLAVWALYRRWAPARGGVSAPAHPSSAEAGPADAGASPSTSAPPPQAGGAGAPPEETASPQAFDPHAVLGVARDAAPEEIRKAYRDRMKEYHPDKVAHLGPELKELAHRKAQDIQKAYRMLVEE